MEKISAIIITLNEERNIGRCIESLTDVADEIIVVDSGSSDATEQICHQAGVRFVHHDWEGYSEQKNYANSLATHPWLLSIDADEALSPTLRENIINIKNNRMTENTAYHFNRLTNYCGHWIHHCGWYPDRCTRLWHQGMATWDGIIHETLRYHAPHTDVHIDGDLLHYSYYSVNDHLIRMTKYAPLTAKRAFDEGKHCSMAGVVLRPMWTFFRTYILKGGFLDGKAGYTVSRMSAYNTFLKYTILRELYTSPASVR